MSKYRPHNATLEFRLEGDRPHVRKTYHAKYTAAQEWAAYQELRELTAGLSAVRPARVYGLDEAENSITIEFIPGVSLWEAAERNGVGPLVDAMPGLVELFAKARKVRLRFDSDPSNLMLDARDGCIVIIDPMCVANELEDFALVVLLWSLVKLAVRRGRPWDLPDIARCWHGYQRLYAEVTGVPAYKLEEQLARYIDIVIGWNLEKNAVEGNLTRMLRAGLIVPAYWTIKSLIRAHAGLVKHNDRRRC